MNDTQNTDATARGEGDKGGQSSSKEAKDKLDFENLKLSHDYAWNWHQYHASQRMNLFRFFLVVVAILAAGYIKALELRSSVLAFGIACAASILAYLFWRADVRSVDLIHIGEGHLKVSEGKLATYLNLPSVQLADLADSKSTPTALQYPSYLYSLKRIIWAIYFLIGAAGLITAGFVIYPCMAALASCLQSSALK